MFARIQKKDFSHKFLKKWKKSAWKVENIQNAKDL